MQREFKERLGSDVCVGKPVAFRRHDYDGYTVELVLYEAHLEQEQLESLRVKDFRWVEADEFSQYPFPPADMASMDDFQLFTGSSKPKKPPKA